MNGSRLDHLLLDLDGTLLDAHFDDYFWEECLPDIVARRDGITPAAARGRLLALYNETRFSLRWADVDYWSQRLGVDIVALKRRQSHLIRLHPGAGEFLRRAQESGWRLHLVTDAHPKTLTIKFEKVDIRGFFDTIICAEDVGAAKTEPGFWRSLPAMGYNLDHCLLVDDNLAALRQAFKAGVAACIQITRPNSRRENKVKAEFFAVASVADLPPSPSLFPLQEHP
ncbi:MAG: HAD hydrolase-like protein [Desulfobulbaceae bacterium]|jgi:putative hydrolase of the HAD superfamily|nr:HAD hydrolase-like protein [Desulfobulbaceae bacterium]